MRKPELIAPMSYNGIKVKPAWNVLIKKLQPMDFFCTQGSGFIGWGIRMITKNLSPDRCCEFNHAGLFPEGTECTLEALWHVEQTNFFEHYEGCEVLIGRYNLMTSELAKQSLSKIIEHIDQPYPKRRIFFHLLNLAHHIHWINAVVCSELVAKYLFYAGARNHKWWGVTPDVLADEIEHELNKDRTGPKYSIIYKGKLPWVLYKYCNMCAEVHLVEIAQNRCYVCRTHYLDHTAILNKKILEKTKEYNDKKLLYIAKKNYVI
jgi:hypothetical protein